MTEEIMELKTLPQENPSATWGFTGTLLWGLLITLVYSIAQAAAMMLYAYVVYGSMSADVLESILTDGTFLAFATFTGMIFGCLVILGIIKLKKNSDLNKYLALNKIQPAEIKYWLLVLMVLMLANDSVTYFLDKPIVVEFMTSTYKNTNHPWFLFLALVIAAPVFEELFFRGFLLTGFSSSFLGHAGAVIITSAAWAAIHIQYDLYGTFTIFVSGIVLGVARLKTNSVLVTIMMHSIMNVVAMIETIVYVALHG